MYQQPGQSPWGKVQTCGILCSGVFPVSTASHSGTMVAKDMTTMLSLTVIKRGFRHSGFLRFEEDTQEDVVLRELLDRKLWAVPDRIKDKVTFGKDINKSLRGHNPGYWRVRQTGLEKTPARQTVPIHNAER